MERGGSYHKRVLRPLFFGTLNTPIASRAPTARAFGAIPFLNGGLFAPAPLERRWPAVQLTDASLGRAFGELFARYRFTAREDSGAWSEAAIDPEMLGKAFESLMSSRERRSSGAFYTPQSLVGEVTRSALTSALMHGPLARETVERALAGEAIPPEFAPALRARIADLRVLDPACGSGAFLVHTLETLASLQSRAGDARPLAVLRRELLTRSIFGVDVNPTAVWLCELRLWLSVVIESEETNGMRVTPLPNLDRHIRVGDSLSGDAFEELRGAGGSAIARMRQRYARATGARKRTLERALQRSERAFALAHVGEQIQRCTARRRDLLAAMRGRDLFGERVRPGAAEIARLARERIARARARRAAASAALRRRPSLRVGDALSRRRAARRLRSRDRQSALGAAPSHPRKRPRRAPRALHRFRWRGLGARRTLRQRRRRLRRPGRLGRTLPRAQPGAHPRRRVARAPPPREDVARTRGRRRATGSCAPVRA